ncbi:MAG: DUF3185 domain-containing protein [Gemmatimonadaceae bacterium]|nr:DUF3185 domain-containing protein [Gemmatimonadaceae bacterium]
MRASVLVGIILIVAGAAIYFRAGFTTREKVIGVGPLSVSAEEEHPVAPWIAGAVVIAGIALVAAGARNKN